MTQSPFHLLNSWLQEEKKQGAPNPQQAVLSTATLQGIPHARIIAIREISEKGLLFFTQKMTRKVTEITENPNAVITFWLELLQREVILEGTILPLSQSENQFYWDSYPREAQLRFHSYAPTSSLPIADKQILEEQKIQLEQAFNGQPIPFSPFYCGFLLAPTRIVFYSYRTDEFSDVLEYTHSHNKWLTQKLSP